MTGYVLDDSVLEAYARGSDRIARLIAGLDGREVRTAIPAVALATTLAHLSDQQVSELLGLIEVLPHMELAPIANTDDTQHLALVIRHPKQPLDMPAAHAAAVALHLEWPVVTLDRSRWDPIVAALPYRLSVYEYELNDPPTS